MVKLRRFRSQIGSLLLHQQKKTTWWICIETDPAKIEIIPPGVDLSRFYPIPPDEAKEYVGIPSEKRMLLFVGRIEPLKGVRTLLKAIGHLSDNGQAEENLCLAVIGGELEDEHGDDSEEMKLLCQCER